MSMSTQPRNLKTQTETAIRRLLKLIVTYDITNRYIIKASSGWRESEQELAVDFDIKGVGLDVRPGEIDRRVLLAKYEVDPGDIVEQIGSFPLSAATASYAFSQLDEFGNIAAHIVVGTDREPSVAWHNPIRVNFNDTDRSAFEAARRKFAEVFCLNPNNVPESVLTSFVRAKRQRNLFIHQGVGIENLHSFVQDLVRVMSGIAFVCDNHIDHIQVYPYHNYRIDFGENL